MASPSDSASKTSKRRSALGFRRSLRRHIKVAAFLGASMVLGNYLVGDRLKESARDAADDANSNTVQFQAQTKLIAIQSILVSLANRPIGIMIGDNSRTSLGKRERGKTIAIQDVGDAFQNVDLIRAQRIDLVAMMHQFGDKRALEGERALAVFSAQIEKYDKQLTSIKSVTRGSKPNTVAGDPQ